MKTRILLLLSLLSFGLFSCEEPVPEVALEDFMYLSLIGAKNNPEIKKLDLTSGRDTVFAISIAYGGTTNYNHGNIEANIEADMSLVDAYNTANSTYYLPLPAGTYSFNETTANIPDGKNSSEPLKLTIKTGDINLSYDYLLPVAVKSVTGGDLPLNEELKTLYIVLTADVDLEVNQSSWVSAGASTEWQNTFFASRAFDGDRDTYWHTDLNGLPQWFAVDMITYKRIDGFTYVNRKDGAAIPKHIKIETSINNVDWETVLEIEELPKATVRQVLPLEQPVVARYFRFTALSNWTNEPYTYVSEISVYMGDEPDEEVDFEKSTWKILESHNDWNPDWHAGRAIDGNPATCWHTDLDGLPKWLVIDTQKSRMIQGIKFWHRQDDHGAEPKHIVFEVSDDNENWKILAEVEELSQNWDEELDIPADNPQKGRYLKVTIKSNRSGSGWTYIGEISLY